MNNKEINIKIEILHYGQLRPYADSEYSYRITLDKHDAFSDNFVKDMCTKALYKCDKTIADEREWFESIYSFDKIAENDRYIYKYTVKTPYMD